MFIKLRQRVTEKLELLAASPNSGIERDRSLQIDVQNSTDQARGDQLKHDDDVLNHQC